MSAVIEQGDIQSQSPRERQIAALKPYKPGQSGNPGGQPRQARAAINKAFLKALSKDFDAYGVQAIQEAREKDPMGYVRVLAGLLPKEIDVKSNLDEINDEQLATAITAVRAILTAEYTREGSDETGATEPAKALSTLPETT